MKKFNCPECGKELIRLEPYVGNIYTFWCDHCNIDISITKNEEKIRVKEPHVKYKEMTTFLNQNGITTIQPIIAGVVDALLFEDVSTQEFEDTCEAIYQTYLEQIFELENDLDIYDLVKEELAKRGYYNNI